MGQCDQPAAPFITPMLAAMAEPSVEREPGKQTAGYPQRQGEQHPVTGTERQNASEGPAFSSVSTTQCSISPMTTPALSVRFSDGVCLLLTFFFSAEELQFLWGKAYIKEAHP